MRAKLSPDMSQAPFAARATEIVRSCVHCGFCNATCPTYQLTGDELEGPRGRVYLIKSLLEGGEVGSQTRQHLDQCLVCRNCETTCPSGVRYGELVDLVRPHVYKSAPGTRWEAFLRGILKNVVPYERRFSAALRVGRTLRPLLPSPLKALVPPPLAASRHQAPVLDADADEVLILRGCAQPGLNPAIDEAAAVVFAGQGLRLVEAETGCCGALAHHLGDEARGAAQARANIDAWWPHIGPKTRAIMASSSGCGVQLRNYGRLLADDTRYAERAAKIEALVRDPLEIIDTATLKPRLDTSACAPIAVQAPCTLQHGQALGGRLEAMLGDLGFELVPVSESHLCCGSAGAYSLLHRNTSGALRSRKLDHLMQAEPGLIVTANIGCQTHLAAAAPVPVRHWLELVADCLRAERS